MSKRIKHYFASAFLVVCMTLALSFQTLAARIAFSDPTGNAGDEITVTMKVTSTGDETIGNVDIMLAYDASALEFLSGTGATGGAGSIHVVGAAESQGNKELSFSLKFRAAKSGTSNITVSTQEIYDLDGQAVSVGQQGSSAVTIQGTGTSSSNASLAMLEVSPGNLSPSFSADVLSYTATVGGDVDRVSVSAPSQDANASVSISGNEGLQIGENQVVCTVTAQDGQTVKTYTITVTKVEGEGEGAGSTGQGVRLKTPERLITIFSIPDDVEVPKGYTQCTIGIDGHDVQGWVLESEEDPSYCIFYGLNESGEQVYYRYDRAERTLQRYFQDLTSSGVTQETYEAMVNEYNSLVHDYDVRFWIIIGLIVLAVILLIAIIALVITRGQQDDFFEHRENREDYPEKMARERENRQGTTRLSREERYQRDLETDLPVRQPVSRGNAARNQMTRERTSRGSGAGERTSRGNAGRMSRENGSGKMAREPMQGGQMSRQGTDSLGGRQTDSTRNIPRQDPGSARNDDGKDIEFIDL
ncbi:MAG: hypothetical protein HFG65_01650 [Hungatella sp.]|nr:hypothetical protein [Hungatella sp.]